MGAKARAGGCRQVAAKDLATSQVGSLASGRSHTVLIKIGRCDRPTEAFPFAAIVRVDGKIVVWGGLKLEHVAQFKADITAEAIKRWETGVVIEDDVDLTGNIVVPCPPPR